MDLPLIFGSKRAQEPAPLPEIAEEVADRGFEAWRIPDTLIHRDPRSDLFRTDARRGYALEVDICARLRRCR